MIKKGVNKMFNDCEPEFVEKMIMDYKKRNQKKISKSFSDLYVLKLWLKGLGIGILALFFFLSVYSLFTL